MGAEVIRLVGVHDLAELLAGDVIFACPRTSWSGYPIKLLNAMAAGAPIVCCEASAHDLVNEETALIAPDNDAEAFANAIVRLVRFPELRRSLGSAARRYAEKHHHPESVSDELDVILKGLTTGN